MYERDRYLTAVADTISNWLGKPLAIIATMAFLFVWTVAAPLVGLPVVGYLVVVMAIASITLLMVLRLQNVHKQDIRTLQQRLDALVADLQASRPSGTTALSDTEVREVRALLQRQADSEDDPNPRFNRDRRPSLF